MHIEKITVCQIDIPLKFKFATAQVNRIMANNIVVKIQTTEKMNGYGESVPRSYVTGENIKGVMRVIKTDFAPYLIGREIKDEGEVKTVLSQLCVLANAAKDNFSGSALCALDLAIFDAMSRTQKTSVYRLLGGDSTLNCTYSIGIPLIDGRNVEKVLNYIKKYQIKHIKVKVGSTPEADIKRLGMVRSQLGDSVDIRVDANCQWSPSEAIDRIKAFEKFNISCVEQPVAANDFAGLAEVKKNIKPAVIADESACSYENVQQLIALDACDIINIKLSKCGGLYNSIRIFELAKNSGKECMLGYHVGETGLLEAADRTFALVARDLKYLEGSLSPLILTENIVQQDLRFDEYGRATALLGIGLGVTVDEAVLNKYTVFREEIN